MKRNFLAVLLALVALPFMAQAQKVKTKTLIDERDGQNYKIIKVGKQWWMAENLRYNPGTSLAAENTAIQDEVGFDVNAGYPLSGEEDTDTYGLYYTWKEANHVCPTGWKLPSMDDWNELIEMVGGKEVAGAKLTSHSDKWREPFAENIKPIGFNVEPSGYRFYILYRLWQVGNRTFFWSSTEAHKQSALGVDFSAGYNEAFVEDLGYRKENAISVRCIKK